PRDRDRHRTDVPAHRSHRGPFVYHLAAMPWRSSVARLAVGVAVAHGIACASARLPAPAYTGHPTDALQPVPYPPPAPHVEDVPPRPSDDVVWIDGEWTWQTRRWVWRPGRWVRPPAGARYAPWTTVRDEDGNLYAAAGTWRDARGAQIAE